MAIKIIKKIVEIYDINIVSYVHIKNIKLIDELRKNGLSYELFNIKHSRFGTISHFFKLKDAITIISILNKIQERNASIILIQGSIELGANFIFWGAILKSNIKSYIPFAHSAKRLGLKYYFLREAINKIYYRLCRDYITISECFKKQINIYNSNAQIDVFKNFLEQDRKEAIEIYNNKEIKNTYSDKQIINFYVVGRIVFSHKGQDIALEAFSNYIKENNSVIDMHLHYVGDGPDLEDLIKLSQKNPVLQKKVHFHGWCDKWWELKNQPDLLIIPSLFEGVPLVMLEAINKKIPIIASAVDGMLDYLNEKSLFIPNNSHQICSLMLKFTNEASFRIKCVDYKVKNVSPLDKLEVFF
ncbi:glycosyltransferase [Xenorhabdus eapokensis]|uniref:Lipopolysaccharide 1,6-galactosyltransferase n=1 Tax=Xenorhabdus eapokensis TaxID=1873482 RepID=A0A1Q5TP16_9GAMM|nr:glycosyltransferase [Xenorhabdus eapokensis]OKP01942.1 lipopolysaccharide 1,6-galactosyltransferase [Xenorhabdus eapokensis]